MSVLATAVPEELSVEVARARNALLASLDQLSWTEFRRAVGRLERQFVKQAATKASKLEVRRRFVSDKLVAATHARLRWPQVRRVWAEVEALGYSNFGHQQQILFALVGWAVETQQAQGRVSELLGRFERRVRRSGEPEDARERLFQFVAEQRRLLTSEPEAGASRRAR